MHLAALLCLVLAWNNRDGGHAGLLAVRDAAVEEHGHRHALATVRVLFPVARPAVQGLVAIRASGRTRAAVCLAALLVLDLGFHTAYAYRDMFRALPPPFQEASDPPLTVRDRPADVWRNLRMNRVSMGVLFPLLGWSDHFPKRDHLGIPGYRGDFVGTQPVQVERWSPNHIVLVAVPGDTLTLNINPFELLARERRTSVCELPPDGAGSAVPGDGSAERSGRARGAPAARVAARPRPGTLRRAGRVAFPEDRSRRRSSLAS